MVEKGRFGGNSKSSGTDDLRGPFFDRHIFISGLTIALDPLLDRLPGRFLLSNNLGILCCKQPHYSSD